MKYVLSFKARVDYNTRISLFGAQDDFLTKEFSSDPFEYEGQISRGDLVRITFPEDSCESEELPVVSVVHTPSRILLKIEQLWTGVGSANEDVAQVKLDEIVDQYS